MAKRSDNYGGVGHNLPPELRAAWKAADKLEAVAERTIADAQAEHDRPRLMNTARRARMGSGVMEEQQRRIANAKTAKQIAEALRDGRAGPLAKIGSLADVERLQDAYRAAMYANKAKREQFRGSMVGVEPDVTDIRHAKPTAGVHAHISPSDVRDYEQAFAGNRKLAKDIARLKKLSERDNWRHSDPRDIQAIANVAKAMKDVDPDKLKYKWQKRSYQWTANKWLGAIREYEAQKRLGLTDADSLRAMLSSYADVRVNRPSADPVKAAERALIGVKMPGYFPTPESLAKRMADLADIREGQTVLEPSAGSGRLADVAKARGANVETVEMQSRLRDLLEKKGHKLVGADFTDMKPEAKYDRILMNPPVRESSRFFACAQGLRAPEARRQDGRDHGRGRVLRIGQEGDRVPGVAAGRRRHERETPRGHVQGIEHGREHAPGGDREATCRAHRFDGARCDADGAEQCEVGRSALHLAGRDQ